MNKVYLLLRNNRQIGPHTLEEIVRLGLKPLDLVWVEGRSSCWSYPSEIPALKPYVKEEGDTEIKRAPEPAKASAEVPEKKYMPANEEPAATKPVHSAKVFVSLPNNVVPKSSSVVPKPAAETQQPPVDTIEQKAEELRNRIRAYTPEKKISTAGDSVPADGIQKAADMRKPEAYGTKKESAVADEPVQVNYSRTLKDVEEDYTSWMYNQKAKKKHVIPEKYQAMGVIAIVLLGLGFGLVRYAFNKTDAPQESALTEKVNVKEDVVKTDDLPATTPVEAPVAENVAAAVPNSKTVAVNSTTAAVRSAPVNDEPAKEFANSAPAVPVSKKALAASKKQLVAKVVPPAIKKEEVVNTKTESPKADNNKTASESREQKAVVTAAPQKKKTLSEKLDGFFNKLKGKKDETRAVETKPAEEPATTAKVPGTSERQSRHRDDETTAAGSTDNIADLIEIRSNESSAKWMLGVHGLKLTVQNRSNELVKSGAVEISYYNEQNELLEKKVLSFASIPPQKSVVVAAPDHRLADHTDYHLLTVNN